MIRLPSGVLAPPGALIDKAHPLAEVLQYVWTGDAPGGGRDRMRGALAGVYSGATRHGTPLGLAIVSNGTLSATPTTPNAPLNAFPYVQIGYGWFNSSGGAWALSWHAAGGGGTISQLALASSTTVSLALRYAFAQPQRTITVTLPTTVGVPICAIAQVFSQTDYRLYVNGRMTTGTTTLGSTPTLDRFYSLGEQLNGGLWLSGHGQGATISDAEALAITANPRVELAKLFQRRVWVPVGAAGGSSLDVAQTANIALSGSVTVSGDIQIGTSFNLAQTANIGLSASAAVSGDIQILSGALDLSQTAAIALSGSASVSGDIQIGTSFDLTQSGAVALSGSAAVSGDIQIASGFDLAQTNVVALSGSLAVSGDVQSSLVPVVVPQGGAGRPRRRVRRVVVEIDGKDFIVNSEEEAIALLDKAKEEAEKAAKVQIQRAAKAAERKPRKVISDARKTLVLPEIKAPGLEEYVSQVLSEIRDSYSSAMRTIEVAALLRKRDRDEEDDEDVLLLML